MTPNFKKTLKQEEAIRMLIGDAVHNLLFGGSRSGKTFLLVYAMVTRALMEPFSRHAILRFRFNHVKTAIWYDTFPKVMKLCYPQIAYKQNKSDWFITMPNGSEIWFGGLDDKERVEKILGNEYATIYFNECSQISWDAVCVALTRLAQKTRLKNKVYYDCNPPSKKHWSYVLFILGKDPKTNESKNLAYYASMVMNPADNQENIAEGYLETVLGGLSSRQRQRFELGIWLDDVENALWKTEWIDRNRITEDEKPDMVRRVVAVDPSVSNNEGSNETGIIVAGLGIDKLGYVEADLTCKGTPNEWAKKVVNAFDSSEADNVVVETNQGGALIKSVLRTIRPTLPIIEVHASRGKITRAEPIAALYEQDRIRHVGTFSQLEEQMTTYIGDGSQDSPDRMDALVWALTNLLPPVINQIRIRSL